MPRRRPAGLGPRAPWQRRWDLQSAPSAWTLPEAPCKIMVSTPTYSLSLSLSLSLHVHMCMCTYISICIYIYIYLFLYLHRLGSTLLPLRPLPPHLQISPTHLKYGCCDISQVFQERCWQAPHSQYARPPVNNSASKNLTELSKNHLNGLPETTHSK